MGIVVLFVYSLILYSIIMSSGSASVVPSGSSSLYTIDKLTSNNFSSWKFRLKMILIDRGLWEVVDGTIKAPIVTEGDEASQAKLVEWKRKDNCALAQTSLMKHGRRYVVCMKQKV